MLARAGSLEDGARLLAHKVSASVRGATVNFEQHNRSSLNDADFFSVWKAFQDELQRRGARIGTAESGVKVVLTISGNLTGYVGVAQVERESNPEVFIEALGLVADTPPGESQAAFALEKEFLFAQDAQMVDVVMERGPNRTQALGTQAIFSYELRGGQWMLSSTSRLPAHEASRRELSGFLFLGVDSETIYLPGEFCGLSDGDAEGWSCRANQQHLPVRAVSPELLAGKKISAWHSAAQFEVEGHPRLMVTGQDALAHLYEDDPEPVASFPNWGNEIASVHTKCGSGWQLLVTSKGDWTAADTVQAFQIEERSARAVSPQVSFPGPVIALHSPTARGADSASAPDNAVAVIHNLQTGRYEAYRLSINCGI